MVTATNGQATFQGESGRMYTIDIYISDVVAADVTFGVSGNAASTSNNYWKAPETVYLVDLSIVTGPTVMVALVPKSNDAIIPNYRFRIANFLSTLAFRPKLSVGWAAGRNIGFVQA
jgi:hypothetical protein